MRFVLLAFALALVASPAAAQPPASNAAMARILAEDQADRRTPIDWKAVGPRDEARRAATAKLLADGALSTAEDFHAAAFIFQHGTAADDYLLAHTLALAAVAKGRAESMWIATATLDRYLMAVGQPQIYGTQYGRRDGQWSQEPYNRALISDALRKVLGVPSQAEQGDRMAKLPGPPKP
jgi:hypothetical protein